MASDLISVRVCSSGHVVFEGRCRCAVLPGVTGAFEVSSNHIPVCARLRAGEINLPGMESKHIEVTDGSISLFHNDKLTVFLG